MTAQAGLRPAVEREETKASRKADRAAKHAFHSRRVWPAMVAALLLTAAGVLTAIEVVSALLDRPAGIFPYGWVKDAAWEDWYALAIFGALAILGLCFLLAALLPGRSRMVPLHGGDPGLVMGVSRRGLRRAVAAAAEGAPGVSGVARVRLGRRRVKVVARTPVHEPAGLDEGVADAVRAPLERLEPLPDRSVRVWMRGA
ncbi:DUF6286 domain-containing protein [Actinomadura livida]|uniref:DUF6286 domain-containing protein n=1 Tax=Actinomadura livida TaxID=79909 RepID=A0A7W7N142_9ACTN|nr:MULTISPECIES: DUF6286 domain-containing protein [Actinomadura]MBB4777562.1 hypothetical protein [Actinomadura catellatispora]GGU00276.1 hypothetical protein GCM10010208_25140 [Actinomadura livida]